MHVPCQTGVVLEIVEVAGLVAVCAGLLFVARRIEPHWASRDGRRFTARVQVLGRHDRPEGGWREVRVAVDGESRLIVAGRGLGARATSGTYRVASVSPDPPRNRAIYVVEGDARLVLRVPARSRARATLDSLLADR